MTPSPTPRGYDHNASTYVALFFTILLIAALTAIFTWTGIAGGTTPSSTSSTSTTIAPTTTTTVSKPIVVRPPTTINDTCTKSVSDAMDQFLRALPNTSTQSVIVRFAPGACYLVNRGIKLITPRNLKLQGPVTFKDNTGPPKTGSAKDGPQAVLWFVGGSGIRLNRLTILGTNPGGYHPSAAFNSAVRSDGVSLITLTNSSVNRVYGDCFTADPLRAAQDDSGTIIGPTRDLTITDLTCNSYGRQGLGIADLTDATMSNLKMSHGALDTFDLEANQWNEGAKDVVITGCSINGGGIAFANVGSGAGDRTSNISVSYCAMTPYGTDAGEAIDIASTSHTLTRGPFVFDHDTFWCGHSVYVACLQLRAAVVSITNSSFTWHTSTLDTASYNIQFNSVLNLGTTAFQGNHKPGYVDKTSVVTNTTPTTPTTVAP